MKVVRAEFQAVELRKLGFARSTLNATAIKP